MSQLTVSMLSPAVISTPVTFAGGPAGCAIGVAISGSEGLPTPASLSAATETVYSTPAVSPGKVYVVPVTSVVALVDVPPDMLESVTR